MRKKKLVHRRRRRVKVVRSTDVPPHDEVDPVFAPGAVEETLQQRCEEVARAYGWLTHHNADSRRADAGLPDLVMISPVQADGTTVLALLELKRDRGTTTETQQLWLDRLVQVTSVVAGVLRPRDWPSFVNLCFDPTLTTTTEKEQPDDPAQAPPQDGAAQTQARRARPPAQA